MIDIKELRAGPDQFAQAARNKKIDVDIAELLRIDEQLLDVRRELQDIRTRQNRAGKEIAKLSGERKQQAVDEMSTLKARARELEDLADKLEPTHRELLLRVPQVPADDVPVGESEADNVEVRRVGEPRKFDFEPKDHVDLGKSLDIIDIERGVKLAGSRNFTLKGAGAMLHQAVLRLALDQMIFKGWTLLTVPVLVSEQAMVGTGHFPLGRDESYLVERDNMALVGTAEVPVTGFHGDEILSEQELPKKYVALSTCFRREAGAAGRDTYGLYRIHYFDKVEQVVIGPDDVERSLEFHREILRNSEDVLEALGLPYRVVNCCTGDIGIGQVQRFDIETYMPSRGDYGETHSASRYHDFQARRLNIRYRDADGELHYCHTLNNTVIASPRILIAVLELYQNADGSVTIPEALRPYMHGMEKLTPA